MSLLFREVADKIGREVRHRIGVPIPPTDLSQLQVHQTQVDHLRRVILIEAPGRPNAAARSRAVFSWNCHRSLAGLSRNVDTVFFVETDSFTFPRDFSYATADISCRGVALSTGAARHGRTPG